MAKKKPVPTGKKVAKAAKKPVKKAAKKVVKKAVKKKPRKKREDLNCFLTTACVRYYGLPDNGIELNTLRRFRDSYLASTEEGRRLIAEYYAISPPIVSRIEQDQDRKSVYAYIYGEVLCACKQIGASKFPEARETYSDMVNTLKKQYHL